MVHPWVRQDSTDDAGGIGVLLFLPARVPFLTPPHVIVIGAGIGGLSTALDLVARGIRVDLFERAERPGGKMREIEIDGRAIDSGPTVFTMPWVFEGLFEAADSRMDEHVVARPVECLARHAWSGGGELDLFADPDRSADAIARMSGAAEGARYRAFCAEAHRVFDTLYEPFIRSARPSVGSLVAASGLRGLIDLWRIRPFESLWRRLGKSFEDPRLRGLFGRYATYCGSSPLLAPATLMLIAHVEQRGVWQIEGGMQRLADALAALITERGGRLHYDQTVAEIVVDRGRATGVRLASGESVHADAVVANADVASLATGRFGAAATAAVPPANPKQRSLSAVTWSLLAETSGFELAHHNVFFPDDYPREFNEIFEQQRLPARPAVYICAQDRGERHIPGPARERLFMIMNAPAVGDRQSFDAERLEPMRSAVFELLEQCGLRLDTRPDDRVVTTPTDFEERFPATGGALYGASAHGWRASFTRPGSRSRLPGLYLAGGSAHPGPGVPMVALSGRMAAAAVLADLQGNAGGEGQ